MGKLHVGDEIQSINGEHVTDKYLAKVNHIIHEALKLGEMELVIRRGCKFTSATSRPLSTAASLVSPTQSDDTFDSKRSMFDRPVERAPPPAAFHRPTPSVNPALPRHKSQDPLTKQTDTGRHSRWTTAPMRNPGAGRLPGRPASSSADERPADPFLSQRNIGKIVDFVPDVERAPIISPTMTGNYRVTSMTPERQVGRLTDFVPESERSGASNASASAHVSRTRSPFLNNGGDEGAKATSTPAQVRVCP
jgi:hypothetical protein